MNYNRYKQKAVLSSILGFGSAILTFLVFIFIYPETALQIAVVCGFASVAVGFPFFIFLEYIDSLRYKKFEAEMGKSIVHAIKAHVETQNGIITSRVYFTEEKIILAYAKGKKFLSEHISLSEIFTVVTDGFFSLSIYTRDKQIFKLKSAEIVDVLPFVKKHSANMNNK